MPYNIQMCYYQPGPDNNRGGDMLRIHGLSGTQKKLELLDRELWKPEEKQEKPEHKLLTGLFFFCWGWHS